MCKVQSLIYLMCIWICILISTPSASTKNEQKHHNTLERLEILKQRLLTQQKIKAKLRTEIREKLGNMTSDERNKQTKNVTDSLLKNPIYQHCRKVAVYIGTGLEVQTFAIIKNLIESNKTCYIPKLNEDGKLTLSRLPTTKEFKSTNKTQVKIDESDDPMKTGDLDMIIVPGLGFTVDGKRLGRGTGVYDQFLNEYSTKHPGNICVSVGLAYDEQICDKIPINSKDFILDYVLYPSFDFKLKHK